MKDLARQFMTAFRSFQSETEKLEEIEKNAEEALKETDTRIKVARREDDHRRTELEALLKDSPREELRAISQKLEAVPEEEDANYWVNYYRGSTGRIYKDEKQKLEARKAKLEKELEILPFTPEEAELTGLRLKEYPVTESERKRLTDFQERLSEQHEAARKAENNFREAVAVLKKGLMTYTMHLEARQVANRKTAYDKVVRELEAMIKQ